MGNVPEAEKSTFVEDVAEICHEVNRAYCECLGDISHLPWDLSPEWVKSSAKSGVHYFLAHQEGTPEELHNSWLEHKAKEGWQYGPVKDGEAKTHPCCVPYGELPIEQRAKDHIFRAIVKTLARRELGWCEGR